VKRYLVILLTVLFMVGIATMAQAQATRTWVSGVGDDVNPCSRTAPCKTFAGAISKTANQGIIDALDPGGFGAVTVTKSIVIDGSDQIAGILASGGSGVVINATNTDVITLRSLEIHGANLTGVNGVNALAFAELNVENCRIQNFNTDGVRIAPTAAQTHKVVVRNSDIRNNLRGVEVTNGASATVFLLVAESNISGHQLGSGVDLAGANSKAAVFNSSITHNLVGLQAQPGTASAYLEGNMIAFNGTGVTSLSGGENRLTRNSIVNNTTNGISGASRCFGTNMIVGNTGNEACTIPNNAQQ